MSYFRSARCPGCGQRYAPDDGACCVKCDRCKGWFGDHSQPEDIPRETIPAKEVERIARAGPHRSLRRCTLWLCPACRAPGDVDAEEHRIKRRVALADEAAAMAGDRAPATLTLEAGTTEVQICPHRQPYVKRRRP